MKARDQGAGDQCCQQDSSEQEQNNDTENTIEEEPYDSNIESEGGYSIEIPKAQNYYGSKLNYNIAPTGNCYMRTDSGCCEMKRMTDTGSIMVEMDPCGGLSSQCYQDNKCC